MLKISSFSSSLSVSDRVECEHWPAWHTSLTPHNRHAQLGTAQAAHTCLLDLIFKGHAQQNRPFERGRIPIFARGACLRFSPAVSCGRALALLTSCRQECRHERRRALASARAPHRGASLCCWPAQLHVCVWACGATIFRCPWPAHPAPPGDCLLLLSPCLSPSGNHCSSVETSCPTLHAATSV